MADQAFTTTQEHFKTLHHEIEVQRLHIESERAEMSVAKAELEQARQQMAEEQKVVSEEKNNPASEAVQKYIKEQIELGIEEEMERQAYFEIGIRETERNSQIKSDLALANQLTRKIEEDKLEEEKKEQQIAVQRDLEEQAIKAFLEIRNKSIIDQNNVTEDDVLADAMQQCETLKMKKLLMRYKRLKDECRRLDPVFTNKVLRNYFTLIRKVGTLWKKGGKVIGQWQQRFVVLTNAGLVYFKVDEMRKEEDLEPQNFKPLNDYCIVQCKPKEINKPFGFKILFSKGVLVQKDLILAANGEQDMQEWITAFRLHSIDTIEAKSKFFEKKLEKIGFKMPRATILLQKDSVKSN